MGRAWSKGVQTEYYCDEHHQLLNQKRCAQCTINQAKWWVDAGGPRVGTCKSWCIWQKKAGAMVDSLTESKEDDSTVKLACRKQPRALAERRRSKGPSWGRSRKAQGKEGPGRIKEDRKLPGQGPRYQEVGQILAPVGDSVIHIIMISGLH